MNSTFVVKAREGESCPFYIFREDIDTLDQLSDTVNEALGEYRKDDIKIIEYRTIELEREFNFIEPVPPRVVFIDGQD